MRINNILYILPLTIIAFLASVNTLYAQYTSVNGNFEVDQVRGCPGLTVNITNNSGIDCGTVGCDFDYKGDGYNMPPDEDIKPDPFTFTYDEAGTYDLYILFGTIEDYITITVEDKPEPEFELFTCAGNAVTINVTDQNYDEYFIDFGDGTTVTVPVNAPEFTHSFPNSTARTISVQGRDIDSAPNCTPATRSYTPVPSLPPPSINALNLTADDEITLEMDTRNDVRYRIFISTNGGSYNILSTFGDGRTSEVIGLPFLPNNYYCFRLDAIDPCGGPPVQSQEVCSIRLSATPVNNANEIRWETNDPSADFELFRDGTLLASVPSSSRTYTDTDILCGTSYCYTLVAQFGPATSTSREICITSDNSLPPPAVNEVSTIPEGNSVTISWLYDDSSGATTFDIFRSESGLDPVRIGTTNDTTFIDNEAFNPGFTTYCYEIVPSDPCGNQNFNNAKACVIQLDGLISLRDEVELNWTPYSGYSSGISGYVVEKSYDGASFTGVNQTSDTVFMETEDQDNQVVYYRVRALSLDPTAGFSLSYTVRLIKSNQLFYPEAFTPDGDGLNDSFAINARYVTDFSMDIFNRWGELIYHGEDITQPWDGTYRGETVPQGTYILKLQLMDEAGQKTTQEASILVLSR